MPRRIKLDKIDRKILRDLQDNGRMTNVELAKRAGISAPPCLRRIRTLEDAGYIKGYYARIDASAVGYGITVFAMIKLSSHTDADVKKFEAWYKKVPQVRECHMLSGDIDFLMRIVEKNWETYQKFLTEELMISPNVASVKTMALVRTTKEEAGVPIEIF